MNFFVQRMFFKNFFTPLIFVASFVLSFPPSVNLSEAKRKKRRPVGGTFDLTLNWLTLNDLIKTDLS